MYLIKKDYSLSLFLLFVMLLWGCSSNVFKSEIPHLIGVDKVLIEDSNVDEEWGGFRGKGYSIETYQLNNLAVKAFKEKVFKALPSKEDNAWAKYDWAESSFDTSYNEVLSTAFDYGGGKKLEGRSNQIKLLLGKPGVFYAFYYRPNKDNPRNVQFFVFDTNTGRIYIIDSNV